MKNRVTTKQLDRVSKKFGEKQVLSSQELEKILGNRMAIKRLVEVGWLTSIARSYYCLSSSNLNRCRILLAVEMYPGVIFDGETALYIYGLQTHMPEKPEIFLEKGSKVSANFLHVTKRSTKAVSGILSTDFSNAKIRVFKLERIICNIAASDEERALDLLQKAKSMHNISLFELRKFDAVFETRVAHLFIANQLPLQGRRKEVNHQHSEKKAILHAALESYSNHGTKGLAPDFLAEMLGLTVLRIKKHYRNVGAIRQAVMDERTRELLSQMISVHPPEKAPPQQFLSQLLEAALTEIESESKQMFRFQCWALAEESYVVHQTVTQACKVVIEVIKNLIRKEHPQISPEEAESRATHLTAMIDSYRQMVNVYSHHLNLEGGRSAFLQRYKRTLLRTFVPAAFSVPTTD